MSTREEIIQELEDLAPALAAMKRREAAQSMPPDGYLGHLADEVLKKVPPSEPRTVRLRWWRGLAAAAVLLAVLAVGALVRQPPAPAHAELKPMEVQQYIQEHIDEFSATLLVDVLEASEEAATPEETTDSIPPAEEDYLDYLDTELLEQLL